MPFIDLEPQPLGTLLETPKGAFVTPGNDDVTLGSDAPAAPGWSDTFKAGWRQDNTIASQLTRSDLSAPTYKEDGFDPWAEIKGTPFEQNWENFADIHNRNAFEMRRAQLEQEEADKRTLAAAPWYKAVPASISAAVLDWPTLLPGGTVVRSAKGGLSIARTAASVGVASAVSAAAQEAALQAEQQTRPLEESVVGIGSSAIVGALIGPALAKGLDHIAWRQAIEAHDRFLAGEGPVARTAAAMPEPVAMRAAPDEVAQDFKIQEEAPAPGEIDRAPEPTPVAAEGEGGAAGVKERGDFSTSIEINGIKKTVKGKILDNGNFEVQGFPPSEEGGAAAVPESVTASGQKTEPPMGGGRVSASQALADMEGTLKGGSIDTMRFSEPPTTEEIDNLIDAGRAHEDAQIDRIFGADAERVKTLARGRNAYKIEDIIDEKFAVESPEWQEANGVIFGLRDYPIVNNESLRELRDPLSNLEFAVDDAVSGDTTQLAKELAWVAPKLPDINAPEAAHSEQERIAVLSLARAVTDMRAKNVDPAPILKQAVEYTGWRVDGKKDDARLLLDRLSQYAKSYMDFGGAPTAAPEQFKVTFKEPQTLIGFLRANGLKDFKGELRAADINKRFPGLVRKNGMELDKAREAAEEAGYLPAGSTPDDLIQAVLSDKPVYSQFDLDQAADFHAQQRAREFERNVAANRKELEQTFGQGGAEPEVYDAAARLMAHEDIDPELAIAIAAETNFNAAPASVGAAASLPASLEGNAIAGKVASTLANLSRFPTKGGSTHWNPLLRVLHSPSSKVRELGLGMAENPIYLNKNMEGVASTPAAETLMKEWQGGLADATRANRSAFNEFRKAGGKMTRTEFNEAVADAMRNNDLSNNPHVQAAAQAWRSKVVEPLKNAAINANLLPEDVHVDTAASYFTRWWNRNKLIAKEQEFKRIVRGWVEGMMPRWQAEFDKETTEAATTMSGKKRADYLAKREAEFEERFGMFPGEVSAGIADDVFDTLTGRIEGADLRPELIKVQARGPLKERTFSIPDRLVKDFFENDVERVMDRYTRTMGADVEIATKFGHLDFSKLEAEINADYQKLSGAAKTEKQRMAIDVARQNDIADIKGIWDLLRGTGSRFAHPWEQDFEHISRMVRLFNYIRLMGEASLASLSETVRPAMVHGLMPYMKTIGSLATNLEGVKLSSKEAQLAGQISEGVLGHRMALMTEISDPYSSTGKAETLMRHMSDIGSKWNGIRLLTDAQKTIASVMTQNRVLDNASKYSGIAGKEKAYMAYLGIDQRMAERITEQFRAHGKLVDGVRVAGTENWTDAQARRVYRAAINKDVDSIITTPGVADVPLFVNTPTGAAMMQFRRFALAAHQRVLLRGLQEDQTRFLGGLIAMTALGMFTTWLKAHSANRDEKLSDFSKKPGWWVGEGVDRSGVLAGTMEVANAFEKMTGFNPVKTPMQAFDRGEARTSQKLQNRNEIGTVFGPSAGLVEDVMSAGKIPFIVAKGERPTKGQKNAAERLLPFNSYPVVRQFMRYIANPQ